MGKTATIIQSSGKCTELGEMHGLYTCLLQHKITETAAKFDWTGPKISEEAWEEMMAFFQWTYDMEKTEAQVRLFVHPTLGWKIWAFPQESASSMTTKEVANPLASEQRAAIGEGYVPFGTVHHHCGIAAFQSGTDLHDEHTVDGLHITIGKMGDPVHDMHARLYLKGNRFEVNMSAFWEIGDAVREKFKAAEEWGMDVESIYDKIARTQMCSKCDPESEFNEVWKTNYLPHKPGVSKTLPAGGGTWCTYCGGYPADGHMPIDCKHRPKSAALEVRGSSQGSRNLWSLEHVLSEIRAHGKLMGYDDEEIDAILDEFTDLVTLDYMQKILDILGDNFTTLKELGDKHAAEKEEREKRRQVIIEEAEKQADEKDKADVAARLAAMTPEQRERFERQQEYWNSINDAGYGG